MIMTMIRCQRKIYKDRKWGWWLNSIPIFLFLSSYTGYSQTYPNMSASYEQRIELKMNKPVIFEDSLTLTLTSFSHKHAITGGPTKATAYVTIVKGELSDEILLSVHGTEGKVRTKNGLVVFDEYDTVEWRGYKIDLQDFSYDEALSIVISKK